MNAPMNFSDTEFEDLYFDRRIFTVVEHFFQQKGRSPGNVAIIRFMMSNPNFKNYYTQIKEVLESGNPIYIPEGGNTMSVNPINYLKCFEPRPNSTYKVSICVEQPIENSREVNRGDNCGHTFLILEQSFDGETIRRSLGFYPSSEWTTVFGSPNQEAMYANNQLHTYHVSISGDLTESNFMAIIEKIRVYYNNQYHYDLYSFNCSTFALNVTQYFDQKVH